MLNSWWCQVGAFLPGDRGELFTDASHRVRGAGLGGPRSDAPGLSPRVSLSSLLEWRGRGLLQRSGRRKGVRNSGDGAHTPLSWGEN